VLIIGSLDRASDLLSLIASSEDRTLEVVGCLDPDPARLGQTVAGETTVIGTMEDLRPTVLNQSIDEVVFAMPLKLIDDVLEHIYFAEEVGVNVRVMPDWQLQKMLFQPEVATIVVEKFVGMPTLVLSSVPKKEFELFLKYLLDRVTAACGLFLLAPLFLLLAMLIKLNSPGPVFFRQERSGLNGRIFTMLKFRTMRSDADPYGRSPQAGDDPRLTRIGKLLRETSLDELPQLLNVLAGQMSLVGPRPLYERQAAQWNDRQRKRLDVRPGITGYAQVQGRGDLPIEEKIELDLHYVENRSLWLDICILFRTILNMTGRKGDIYEKRYSLNSEREEGVDEPDHADTTPGRDSKRSTRNSQA